MKGNNSIEFCEKQVMDIVQHYFDTQMFREGQSPTVTGVTVNNAMHQNTFTVKCEPPKEPKE